MLINHTSHLAAPEKNTYDTRLTKDIPLVTQGIDIWSLGCVFSVAATYVVTGKEGVKQYRLLRQRALSNLKLGMGDTFHNTKVVLPEVMKWHQYLRTCVRAQDDYTTKVLDIVDRSMLTLDEERVSAADLAIRLDSIMMQARRTEHRPRPPGDILEFLDDVMTPNEAGYSPALKDLPRTSSHGGADMFEEALLYRSLRSEGRPPFPRNTRSRQSNYRHDSAPGPSEKDADRGFGTPTDAEVGPQHSGLSLITTVSNPERSFSHYDPPITFWEVEAELSKTPGTGPIGRLRGLTRRQSSSSKLMERRDDELLKHFHNRDLVSKR